MIGLRESNPAILDVFAERDLLPYRDLLRWSGEFAGKYITGAYYLYRLTLDASLYEYTARFIEELLSYQAPDGYLGCYSEQCHLTGAFSQTPEVTEGTWGSWSHYYIMYGLLLWYRETKKPSYLAAVERIAGLFLRTFYQEGGRRLVDIGMPDKNLAPIHSFTTLYEVTGKREYLDFARRIEEDFSDPRTCDYIKSAAEGIDFYACTNRRWESLHTIMGIAGLYRATGKEVYLQTAEFMFRSILKTDVHNTGAFSTKEKAIGNPFESGPIESCCVVAYNALGIDLYLLTGDPAILDFLEQSHYNACFGMWSPTGRWSTYDTPMNGERKASYHQIVFQSRAGGPELNCCSVNMPCAIGNCSEWRFTQDADTLYLNLWEAGEYITEDGVKIRIEGAYPGPGAVRCSVEGYTGKLALEFPAGLPKHT